MTSYMESVLEISPIIKGSPSLINNICRIVYERPDSEVIGEATRTVYRAGEISGKGYAALKLYPEGPDPDLDKTKIVKELAIFDYFGDELGLPVPEYSLMLTVCRNRDIIHGTLTQDLTDNGRYELREWSYKAIEPLKNCKELNTKVNYEWAKIFRAKGLGAESIPNTGLFIQIENNLGELIGKLIFGDLDKRNLTPRSDIDMETITQRFYNRYPNREYEIVLSEF